MRYHLFRCAGSKREYRRYALCRVSHSSTHRHTGHRDCRGASRRGREDSPLRHHSLPADRCRRQSPDRRRQQTTIRDRVRALPLWKRQQQFRPHPSSHEARADSRYHGSRHKGRKDTLTKCQNKRHQSRLILSRVLIAFITRDKSNKDAWRFITNSNPRGNMPRGLLFE